MPNFKVVSITTQDITKETKGFLLDGRADYMACGACEGGLFFTKDTISSLYSELVEEEDKSSVFEDIANLLTRLHDERADMLFLN